MLRIWAVIAGLYFFMVGQALVPPGPLAPAAAFDPAGGTPAAGSAADPVPQVMQVYVMAPGGSTPDGGNAAAAGEGVESQGTAFYLDAGGQRVIVAPYHAWVLAGATIAGGQVYLAGQAKGPDGAWTRWAEPARVLGADTAEDLVFLAPVDELKAVEPLAAAGAVNVGDRLHGSGYEGGMTEPNGFAGQVAYCGPETELAGTGWRLDFQGYGLQGGGVEPGDSGSPALTADGRVAGEVVAAGNGWILVVPVAAIEEAATSLKAA